VTKSSFAALVAGALVAALTSHPAPAPLALGTALNYETDDTPVFTRDGNTAFFDRQIGAHKSVMIARKVRGVWQVPQVAPFSGHWFDQNPEISPDGSYLLFNSDRPTRTGGRPLVQSFFGRQQPGSNIWRVDRRGNAWGKPFWLGPVINDGLFVDFPDIVADGSLYFLKRDRGAVHIFRSQYQRGRYLPAARVAIGNDTTPTHDAAVAPDESFMILDYGRVKGGLGRLCIAYRRAGGWSKPIDLGDTANADLPWGFRLAPDHETVYFTGSTKVWSLSLRSWASPARRTGGS
jgi:WD40-like Beta Propeller Repeat